MSTTTTTSAQWDAMSEKKKEEWLLKTILGLKIRGIYGGNIKWMKNTLVVEPDGRLMRPLRDWNHWRQVEEKVMDDDHERLWISFMKQWKCPSDELTAAYMESDLPTRARALYIAFHTLKP